MLIPILDIAGEQIAWIDHVKLEAGTLFREGERVFRLAEDGTLRQVVVGTINTADLIDVADGDQGGSDIESLRSRIMPGQRSPWSADDLALLAELWPETPIPTIAGRLGRTRSAVCTQAAIYRLKRQAPKRASSVIDVAVDA